jgi:ankyrin repeat protein
VLHFHAYKERRSNVEPAQENTFSWIWDHPKYLLWENGRSSSLLWLQGKPGSGKSTLANFVRSRVKHRVGLLADRQTIVVDFFYSVRGGRLQNGHYWMLRSVLYQFLLQTPGIWENYRESFRECRRIEKSDAWRIETDKSGTDGSNVPQLWSFARLKSLFDEIGSIHAPWLRVTAYVIVDALDESEENCRQDIIQMFRKVSKRDPAWPIAFKIFLTSRPDPKIEQALEDCHKIVLEDETSADIVNYVNGETKRIAREILKCSHEELSFISSHLINASRGIFLWVKLVLDQLDVEATNGFCSVAELEELLLSIPENLRQLYELILKRIVEGPDKNVKGPDKNVKGRDKNVRECQTVFRWIAFSPTPLRVEEMLEVVAARACSDSDIITRTELQRHRVRNTEDMRRRLISLCGNLVEVKGRIVQFIHTSVREYLLESAYAPPISLAREDSLFEIASLCATYVDGFRDALQRDQWLSNQRGGDPEQNGTSCDTTIYTGLIDEFNILRYLFGCEPAYQTSLDRELSNRCKGRSLRTAMSSAWKSLQPVVLEAIARVDIDMLGELILEAAQINAPYPVPRNDIRFNQNFVLSPFFGHATEHLNLSQLASLLSSPRRLDVLDLLHKHGADPNCQEASGRTALHMAVLMGSLARTQLQEAVEDLVAVRINNSFIIPGTELLGLFHRLALSIQVEIRTFLKACVILSAAMYSGYDLLNGERSESKISSHQLLLAASQLRPLPGGSPMRPSTVWSTIWALVSAQKRLVRILVESVIGASTDPKFRSGSSSLLNAIVAYRESKFHVKFGEESTEMLLDKITSAASSIDDARSLVSRLLDHGADPTIQDNVTMTPLNLALDSGLRNFVVPLLGSVKRSTEYELALANDRKERAHLLRQAGTFIARLLYDECTRLGSDHIISWLLVEQNLDPKFVFNPKSVSRDGNGRSAMHAAASKANAGALQKMLAFGFSMNAEDRHGRTAMDIANDLGHGRVIAMLLNHKERLKRLAREAEAKSTLEALYVAEWSWKEARYLVKQCWHDRGLA